MKCPDSGSQLRELMKKSSKGTEESHDFKTNVLCVNAGDIEVGQLFHVVTEEEESRILAFQEMK